MADHITITMKCDCGHSREVNLYTIKGAARKVNMGVHKLRSRASRAKVGIDFDKLWVFTDADLEVIKAMRGPGQPRKVKPEPCDESG